MPEVGHIYYGLVKLFGLIQPKPRYLGATELLNRQRPVQGQEDKLCIDCGLVLESELERVRGRLNASSLIPAQVPKQVEPIFNCRG